MITLPLNTTYARGIAAPPFVGGTRIWIRGTGLNCFALRKRSGNIFGNFSGITCPELFPNVPDYSNQIVY